MFDSKRPTVRHDKGVARRRHGTVLVLALPTRANNTGTVPINAGVMTGPPNITPAAMHAP